MTPSGQPFSDPQQLADDACAKAERLVEAAMEQDRRLRDARRELSDLQRDMAEASLADPRSLAAAKADAQRTYRQRRSQAVTASQMTACAVTWLAEIDRLNRTALRLAGRSGSLSDTVRQAQALVEHLELSARAASVAADRARDACVRARRAQARRDDAHLAGQPGEQTAPVAGAVEPDRDLAPIEALVSGDRPTVERLAAQVAQDTGMDRGRLQLLLLELREAIVASALDASILDFPADHPFWSQFTRTDGRALVSALAVQGRRFDGRGSWLDGHVPEPREMSLALSLCGQDPRSLRQRPTRQDLAGLWRGTSVAALELLHDRAPDLGLDQMVAVLGARAEALNELWEFWHVVRRLLLAPQRPIPAA